MRLVSGAVKDEVASLGLASVSASTGYGIRSGRVEAAAETRPDQEPRPTRPTGRGGLCSSSAFGLGLFQTQLIGN